ncbi:MAG TPA: hypothetical protein RMF84_20885, partial [Polyangiaceae bacterium LLY-WYZ-14_1]|nr:hypothetical protein [Polyangiaceae bacterium LLY-WYZ-14_1]
MRPDRLLPRPATPGARHRPGAGPEGRPGWGAAALRLVVASAVLPAAVARGQTEGDGPEDPLAVRVPVRLTAGGANQFMGRLSPDGDALYFVSDEAGTTELFVQSPVDGGAPERLFDESGDVAWPEVGPDGNRLAYVSYVRDATGDACVRRVRGGNGDGVGGARGERCLTRGGRGAELQVVWLGPDVLGVLSREDLHAGFSLRRFSLADGASQPLDLGDDAVGVAVSPAGGFLAYVPLEPRRQDVGVTFVNRTGSALRFVRLRGNGEADSGSRRDYAPPLPGVTGYPAFGPAGRHLYFSQYLNDTNRDGRIDGNDNSVVFRVPFDPEAPAGTSPVDPAATPTQLTSARWNCHYPAPAAGRLLMTCSHGGSLDIYSLPLDGAVPTEMSLERLRGERAAARDLWTKLLLSGRMLALEPDPAARLGILEEMTLLHLGLREYESASHYADRLAASARDATEAARVGRLLGVLAAHRRDDR